VLSFSPLSLPATVCCLSLSAFCLFVHLFIFVFVILSLLFLPGINHNRNINPEQTQAGIRMPRFSFATWRKKPHPHPVPEMVVYTHLDDTSDASVIRAMKEVTEVSSSSDEEAVSTPPCPRPLPASPAIPVGKHMLYKIPSPNITGAHQVTSL
jgi:hypothetical protein